MGKIKNKNLCKISLDKWRGGWYNGKRRWTRWPAPQWKTKIAWFIIRLLFSILSCKSRGIKIFICWGSGAWNLRRFCPIIWYSHSQGLHLCFPLDNLYYTEKLVNCQSKIFKTYYIISFSNYASHKNGLDNKRNFYNHNSAISKNNHVSHFLFSYS